MGRPDGSLVTSVCRRRGIERSKSPERTGRRPVDRTFGGGKNDCSWKPVRDPAWNASCILRRAQGSWPLTLRGRIGCSDLVVPVWIEVKGCHVSNRRVLGGAKAICHLVTKGRSL